MLKSYKAVKSILIINIIVFIAVYMSFVLGMPIAKYLVLYPPTSDSFRFYQFITSMFMHGSLSHIVFNMIGLVIFGPEIEKTLGSYKFIIYYLLAGIIGAVSHFIFSDNPIIGASGAIWFLIMLYTLLMPNNIFNFYFLIPIKIKYITSILFAIEVYSAFRTADGTSHIAHIGGALTAVIIYIINRLETKNKKIRAS